MYERVGFAMGWNAWYNWAVILPAVSKVVRRTKGRAHPERPPTQEISAATVLMRDFFIDPMWSVHI